MVDIACRCGDADPLGERLSRVRVGVLDQAQLVEGHSDMDEKQLVGRAKVVALGVGEHGRSRSGRRVVGEIVAQYFDADPRLPNAALDRVA